MHRLSDSDLRFEMVRAVQSMSRRTLRDLLSKSPMVADRALEEAVDHLAKRLDGKEVFAPEPRLGMDFADMDRP